MASEAKSHKPEATRGLCWPAWSLHVTKLTSPCHCAAAQGSWLSNSAMSAAGALQLWFSCCDALDSTDHLLL